MKIKPLQDWAVIRPSKAQEKSPGGIIIPEAVAKKPQEGEVVSIGEGRNKEKKDRKGNVIEKKFEKTTLKPGDRVLYEKYAAVEIPVEGEELLMVREDDVLGLLQ